MPLYNLNHVRSATCNVVPFGINNIEARYLLEIDLKNVHDKVMTYIMMNPSKAEELILPTQNISDDTVNLVIKFAFDTSEMQIGKVNVINLFGVYKTNSPDLKPLLDYILSNNPITYNQLVDNNRIKSNEAILESDYIVLAWGDIPDGMDAATHSIETQIVFNSLVLNEKLDKVYVLKSQAPHHKSTLSEKKRPRHPSRISFQKYVRCLSLSFRRNYLNIIVPIEQL